MAVPVSDSVQAQEVTVMILGIVGRRWLAVMADELPVEDCRPEIVGFCNDIEKLLGFGFVSLEVGVPMNAVDDVRVFDTGGTSEPALLAYEAVGEIEPPLIPANKDADADREFSKGPGVLVKVVSEETAFV